MRAGKQDCGSVERTCGRESGSSERPTTRMVDSDGSMIGDWHRYIREFTHTLGVGVMTPSGSDLEL